MASSIQPTSSRTLFHPLLSSMPKTYALFVRSHLHQTPPVKLVSEQQLDQMHMLPSKVASVPGVQLPHATTLLSGVPLNTRTHGFRVYVPLIHRLPYCLLTFPLLRTPPFYLWIKTWAPTTLWAPLLRQMVRHRLCKFLYAQSSP